MEHHFLAWCEETGEQWHASDIGSLMVPALDRIMHDGVQGATIRATMVPTFVAVETEPEMLAAMADDPETEAVGRLLQRAAESGQTPWLVLDQLREIVVGVTFTREAAEAACREVRATEGGYVVQQSMFDPNMN